MAEFAKRAPSLASKSEDEMVLNAASGHVDAAMIDCHDADRNARARCVLVISADSDLLRTAIDYLDAQDMPVRSASRGLDAIRIIVECEPDIVILDLQLGDEDGLGLLRDVRDRSNVPVIIVSGNCCGEPDRVNALELGADGCITKPFGLRELLARIRAVLRRQKHPSKKSREHREHKVSGQFRFGGWLLDPHTRRLTNPAGTNVKLTKNDLAILRTFVEAPQRPLTREYLLQATRIHEDIFDRSIDVQVLRLRRKLEADPTSPRIILTERGFGYMFALKVERA